MDEKIKKLNEQINKLSEQLGKKPKIFEVEEIEDAKTFLAGLTAQMRDFNSELSYSKDAFISMVDEMSRSNIFLSRSKSAMKGLAGSAMKIDSFRRGETSLDKKQLEALQEKSKLQFDILEQAKKSKTLGEDDSKNIEIAIKSKGKFNDEIEQTINATDKVNKNLGTFGQSIDGIAKAASKIGFTGLAQPLKDSFQELKNNQLQIELNSQAIISNKKELEKLERPYKFLTEEEKKRKKELLQGNISLKEQNKELETQTSRIGAITKAFKSQLTLVNAIDFVLVAAVKSLLALDKQFVDIQKNTLRTASEARIFREQLSQASIESGNINITTSKLLEAYNKLNTQFGFIGDFQAKSLEMQTRLTKLVGLDEKSAAGLVMLSEARGKNAETEYKSVLGTSASMQRQKGIQLDLKSILSEVGNVTGQVRANLGANPELLARAVTEAKALGGELEDVKNISKSLLQFQSSIEAELEAELLTGKQLNLERARSAALMGDMETLASEISSQAGSFADFSNMNVIQQEALASAFGLSADRLSDMLFKQQAMGRSAKELRDAGENELAEMMEKQNAQEKFNASVEKLKELFTDAVTVFSPILDIFSSLADLLGESKVAMTAFKIASAGAVGAAAALAAYNIIGSFAKIPFGVGWPLGIAAVATMGLSVASQSKAAKAEAVGDLNSPATGKTVVSTKEGGLFELSSNDDLVAAPGASRIMEGATSPAANNNAEILNAIHNINKRLEEQYNAIKNMKVILSTNKLEVGLVQNAVEIQ